MTPRAPLVAVFALVVLTATSVLALGCAGTGAPPKVKVKLRGTPPDATVIIDDQPTGPLRAVQKLGLALTPGRHRITVEREGYFPWDRVIDTAGGPLELDVQLEKLPE